MRSSWPRCVSISQWALVALCLTSAQTEAKKRHIVAGVPVTETGAAECHAALDDPQGFKNTLLRHDALRSKFKSGVFALPGRVNLALASKTPEALISTTSNALADLAEAKTALLIYDISQRRGKRDLLCVWMLSTNGLVAAESTEVLAGPPAAYLARQALRVDSRVAARVPVPLRARRDTTHSTAETSPRPSLRELSDALLPPSIQRRLAESEFHRLLILPAADIGTVPWPALPIGNEMIVDRLAVVVLLTLTGWSVAPRRSIA